MTDHREEHDNRKVDDEEKEALWLKARNAGLSRRTFLALLAAGGTAAVLVACGVSLTLTPSPPPPTPSPTAASLPPERVAGVVLPPLNAKVVPTACDYCVVGCAYKAYIWPVGTEGGPSASENALRTDFPVGALTGKWISPNMQNIVTIRGEPHHVLVIPDGDATVVNVGGDHSVRGGTLAQKLYNPNTPTRDRLQHPRLRIGDSMIDIPWDDALNLAADISRYVLDNYGEMAWAQKMFFYHYYENTYALTKAALDAVNTPCWAPHDKPADGADTPGLSDAGINAFSAAYQDWKDAEVIYVSGVTLYETKTILFQEWVQPGGAKLVVVNPRRDFTAAYAEANGGIHLQLIPGTDTPLNNAIARVIIENGWQDSEFIDQRTVSDTDLAQETSWRRRMFGKTYQQYRDFILSDDSHIPENAAPITGVPADQIRAAAEMLARPKPDGSRPATSMMLEKGNYWAHNYENTASFSGLGLLVGAGGRAGRVMARAGGHQRGMTKGQVPRRLQRQQDRAQLGPLGHRRERPVHMGHRHHLARRNGCLPTPRRAGPPTHPWHGPRAHYDPTPSPQATPPLTSNTTQSWTSSRRASMLVAWSLSNRRSTKTPSPSSQTFSFPPHHGAKRTSPACRASAVYASTQRSWTRPERPNPTGGSAPKSPDAWASTVSTGPTPTRFLKKHRSAPAARSTTTQPW